MDVRLAPAAAAGRPRSAVVAVVVGVVLLVAPLAAVATQGLDPLDRLDALLLAATGLLIACWAGWRLGRPGPRLRHPTDLSLDGVGVTVPGAALTCPDVALVEVRWWEIVPPYVDEPQHLPVLRFVARDDRAIVTGPALRPDDGLAHAFGISPAAAALTVVVGPDGLEALQQVLGWVAEHRSDVPVEVGAPPAL